jgi:hypothetical protein
MAECGFCGNETLSLRLHDSAIISRKRTNVFPSSHFWPVFFLCFCRLPAGRMPAMLWNAASAQGVISLEIHRLFTFSEQSLLTIWSSDQRQDTWKDRRTDH